MCGPSILIHAHCDALHALRSDSYIMRAYLQYSAWGACSAVCGIGTRKRTVACGAAGATCGHCTAPLQEPCFSDCATCEQNGGQGPCVFGGCASVAGSVQCTCDAGWDGARRTCSAGCVFLFLFHVCTGLQALHCIRLKHGLI